MTDTKEMDTNTNITAASDDAPPPNNDVETNEVTLKRPREADDQPDAKRQCESQPEMPNDDVQDNISEKKLSPHRLFLKEKIKEAMKRQGCSAEQIDKCIERV